MLLIVLKKSFFNLMIDRVNGKSMEGLRVNRLVNNEKDFF